MYFLNYTSFNEISEGSLQLQRACAELGWPPRDAPPGPGGGAGTDFAASFSPSPPKKSFVRGFDKASYVYELFAAKFEFRVAPSSFVLHLPGPHELKKGCGHSGYTKYRFVLEACKRARVRQAANAFKGGPGKSSAAAADPAETRGACSRCGAAVLVSQERVKSDQHWPKSGQERLKSGPRAAKRGPRAPKSGPRAARSGSKVPKSDPKGSLNDTKRHLNGLWSTSRNIW